MRVVHCRYQSAVQTFSVPVLGVFASVADLKRLIAATATAGPGAAARETASRSATPAPAKVRACDPIWPAIRFIITASVYRVVPN